MLPTLPGTRVQLRWLTERDVPDLLEIFRDPEVARFIGIPRMATEKDARLLLTEIEAFYDERTLFQWGIARLEDGRLLGTVSLADLQWKNERAEIGFVLGRPHWGHGYAEEAVRLLLDHAFEGLGIHRIEADVDPRNVASLKLLEKLGFQREGYLPERHLIDGERQDSIFLGLLAHQWGVLSS